MSETMCDTGCAVMGSSETWWAFLGLIVLAVLLCYFERKRSSQKDKETAYIVILLIGAMIVIFSVSFLKYELAGKDFAVARQQVEQAKTDVLVTKDEVNQIRDEVLGIKQEIERSQQEIEKNRTQLNTTRTQLLRATMTTLRMVAIAADGSGHYDGIPQPHQRRIEKYRSELQQLLGFNSPEFTREIDKELAELNAENARQQVQQP